MANEWNECPCGESVKVPDSEFGKIMLAEWRKMHHGHAALGLMAGQEGGER